MKPKEIAFMEDAADRIGGFLHLDEYYERRNLLVSEDGFGQDLASFLLKPENFINPKKKGWDPSFRWPLNEFLLYFNQGYLQPLIEENRPRIQARILGVRERLQREGFQEVLPSLSDRISYNRRTDTLQLEKKIDWDFDGSLMDRFLLSPSLFCFPYMIVGKTPDDRLFQLAVEIDFLPGSSRQSALELVARTSAALSDKSRLRMLLMLTGHPLTQTEIQQRMGFAKSTVSRHMGLLKEAGLIRSAFDSHGRNVLHIDEHHPITYTDALKHLLETATEKE